MRTLHVLHGEFSLTSLFSLATEMTVDGSVILFTFSFTWGTGLLLEAWPGNSSLSCSLSSGRSWNSGSMLFPLCKGDWEVRLVLQHIPFSHLRVPVFDYVPFYFNLIHS